MRTRSANAVAVAVAVVLLPAPPLGAQARPQPPVFGTGIEIINLNVSVADRSSRFVTDLLSKDFVIFEDGIRQELSLFTHEDLPISLVLMIDTSASMEEKLPVAQAAAKRFLGTLRPPDLAQVVQFNDRAGCCRTSPATGALEAAIKKTVAAGPTSLHNALYVALKELSGQEAGGDAAAGHRHADRTARTRPRWSPTSR